MVSTRISIISLALALAASVQAGPVKTPNNAATRACALGFTQWCTVPKRDDTFSIDDFSQYFGPGPEVAIDVDESLSGSKVKRCTEVWVPWGPPMCKEYLDSLNNRRKRNTKRED